MVLLKCQRCGYQWEYKGKSEWYAPCSRCKTSVNIKKQKPNNNKKTENNGKNCSICGNNKNINQMENDDICKDCSKNIIQGLNLFKKDTN